jgi:hypothetical protein
VHMCKGRESRRREVVGCVDKERERFWAEEIRRVISLKGHRVPERSRIYISLRTPTSSARSQGHRNSRGAAPWHRLPRSRNAAEDRARNTVHSPALRLRKSRTCRCG